VAGITGLAVLSAPLLAGLPDGPVLAGKLILVPALYLGFLYAAEREQLLSGVRMIRSLLPNKDKPDSTEESRAVR
jgi:hypothetical protein